MSEDKTFLAIGDNKLTESLSKQKIESTLSDPQVLNSYAYARNNPLRLIDKDGNWYSDILTGQQSLANFTEEVGQATEYLTNHSQVWNYALDNPIKAGLAVGVVATSAATPAVAGVAGIAGIEEGVSAAYVAKMAVGSAFYEYIATNALKSLPKIVKAYSQFNLKDAKTWKDPIIKTALIYGPGALGEHIGSIHEIFESVANIATDIGKTKKEESNTK